MRINHDNKCELYCTDNDKTAVAEVMNFRPEESLTVVLAESKIVMRHNKVNNIYVGSLFGKEFTTKGPKYYEHKEFRRTR